MTSATAPTSTNGNRKGLWRSPTAGEADHGGPNARDKSGAPHLQNQATMAGTGQLNPDWIETRMGVPIKWTLFLSGAGQ